MPGDRTQPSYSDTEYREQRSQPFLDACRTAVAPGRGRCSRLRADPGESAL